VKSEELNQGETCRSCGMPYGQPQPETPSIRSYCHRCANLPENILAVLELRCKQLAQKAMEVEDPIATITKDQ
jgi:hypothetical protein